MDYRLFFKSPLCLILGWMLTLLTGGCSLQRSIQPEPVVQVDTPTIHQPSNPPKSEAAALFEQSSFPEIAGFDAPSARTPEQFIANSIATQNQTSTAAPNLPDQGPPDDIPSKPDDLWQALRDEFTWPLHPITPPIQSHLNWYQRHPEYLQRVSARATPYLYFIKQQLQQQGLPAELALLPIIESAFDPFAYSPGRATGLWQFIPGTGKRFNLTQDWWYDGRRDVVAATEAAIAYLTYLHQLFDQVWLLAIAAYNMGEGALRRAIEHNQKRQKPTDFWSLTLSAETQKYVPKLLALIHVIQQPERFGLALTPIANQPHFVSIDSGGQIDLAKAAKMAKMDLQQLYRLNPGFNQWATRPDGPHRLLVPVDQADTLRQALAAIPKSQRVTWQRYAVKSGDTLSGIAKQHHVTVKLLQSINSLKGSLLRAGQPLLIPSSTAPIQEYALSSANRLASIQSRNPNPTALHKLKYRVRSGDSFWSIAQAHNVKIDQLAKWNGLSRHDTLKVGRQLIIWQPRNSPSTAQSSVSPQVIRKLTYAVKQGDSLSRIAQRFKLQIADIKRWNSLDQRYLQPGQPLTLYVNVTQIQH